MASQRYKLERDRGAALTQHHLLSLTVSGNGVEALESFRQRFQYVYEALDATERPTDNGIRSLFYEQLKNRPKMMLHIDRYRNSSSTSSKRTWQWLHQKMVEVIEISHLEENSASVDKALSYNPNAGKKDDTVPANAANPDKKTKAEKKKEAREAKEKEEKEKERKDKEKEKKKQKEKEKKEKARAAAAAASEAETPAAAAAKAKGGGKGGGNKGTPKSPRTKEEKAKLPCMFWAYNACTAGDSCEYLHDKGNLYKGPKPRGLKAPAGAATVLAGAAFASAIPGSESAPVKAEGSSNAPIANGTELVNAVVSKVKGVGHRMLRRVKKAKVNGSMLPQGGVFAKALTTIMTAMAMLDPLVGAGGGNAQCAGQGIPVHDLKPNKLYLDFLLDSGAGRNLISRKSLPVEAQGLFSQAPEKLKFSTGGGTRSGSEAIAIEGELSGQNTFYQLTECPPAISVGMQVQQHKRPWIWMPGELPYFIKSDRLQDVVYHCPEDARIYADRVEQNVPILREAIKCSALACPPEALSHANVKATPSEPASSSSDPPPPHLRKIARKESRPEYPTPEPVEAVTPKVEPLRLKPDGSLPRFGDDDELRACAEPEMGEMDQPLDEEDAETHPKWTPSLRERLVKESKSLAHLLTHYPKNRYCEICKRAKMTAKVHRSRKDEEMDSDETPPLHYGHRLRADHIILGHDLTKGSEGEQACLIAYDEYSGCFGAFPQTSRNTEQNVAILQKFGGNRAHGKALCNVKSDAASELVDAVKALNWLPDPGVPNDPYHNSQLERAVRTIKEGTRSIHLKAGFPHDLWPRSIEYFCTARSFTTAAPVHPNETDESKEWKANKTCYEVANKGEPFEGHRIPLGALVYYKPPQHRDLPAFDPRTYPGIFCGWRMDSGYKFRGVHLVLDYEALRKDVKGCGRPIQVYASELVVPDTFVFPLHEAQVEKLSLFKPEAEMPVLEVRDSLPFAKGAPEPKVRKRKTYVTLERAIRFGKTLGCKGCDRIAEGVPHNDACHERFRKLLEEEAAAKEARAKAKSDSAGVAATPSMHAQGGISSVPGVDQESSIPAAAATRSRIGDEHSSLKDDQYDYWEFDVGLLAWKRVHVKPRKKMYIPIGKHCPFSSQEVTASRETTWKCRGKTSTFKDNWQEGNPGRRISSKSWVGSTTYFPKDAPTVEQGILLAKIANAAEQAKRQPVAPKGVEALASIIQDVAGNTHNDKEAQKFTSKALAAVEDQAVSPPPKARKARGKTGYVMFEFCCEPDSLMGEINASIGVDHFRLSEKNCDLSDPVQGNSLRNMTQMFPGCDLWASIPCGPWSPWQNCRRRSPKGDEKLRLKKEASERILKNFVKVADSVIEQGGHIAFEWPKSSAGWTNPVLLRFIKKHNLYEAITDGCALGLVGSNGRPLLKRWRVVTTSWRLAQNLSAHRCQHDAAFRHGEIRGKDAKRAALYTPKVVRCITHSLYPECADRDVPAMPTVPFTPGPHNPNEASENQELVYGGIHQLIDKRDWKDHAGAQDCIHAEAKGLIDNGTWNYSEVVSRKELLARNEPLNIGRLMTILSIKHFETPSLRKLKARIVFRGDDIRDESNNLAVLQELKVNPTGIVGINFNLAYGAMEGHCSSQSDVVKAYTQSNLNTKVPTWVELPWELTPLEFRGIERPCVRLWKSLYGHPESGFHWHERFKNIMKMMGGEHSELFQSSFWFSRTRQLLTLYVDDIVLSGPRGSQPAFWEELQRHLEIEPPSEVDRVLGRRHVYQRGASTVMTYDMSDYCQNACDLYEQLSHRKLKEAATPFVAEGSLLTSDWETRGQLADAASRVLMKSLWLARLSRPDVMKPLSDLTRRVTCWSTADDKRLYRLMCYLHSTPERSITHTMGDKPESLKLSLYTDADHASDVEHAQSTSGMLLCLEGERTFWPLAWASKKQTATSRSTTEAEVISLAHGVFSEGLPMQEFMEKVLNREVTMQCHQDNSAVIQIVHAGYSPKLRHVSKTHRIDLSSLYEVFEDPYMRLTYINTEKQCADIFTKALTPAKFPAALRLLQME